ncbi:MAG: zinc-dependent alcohol dehydrogenase family protein [Chloroflexi bacterium]|nr:zinc-dependent alcohol dehydrogenase family protein [Chloroflexota bacterium]
MKTKAAVLSAMGQPAPYGQSRPLTIEDVTLDGPKSGEVLVEIAAAGLCHSDLSVINGSRPRPMPMIIGHEASGIVREVGPGVAELAPGDHVVFSYVPMCGHCLPCSEGRPAMCENGAQANLSGTLLSGSRHFHRGDGSEIHHHLGVSSYAHFTVAAQESLIRIDDNLPLEIAALFGCAVMTGVGAVVNTARVSPGQSVAVFGLGGVGMSAVMGARAAGAWPIIAVDLLDSKLDLAGQFGATHRVNVGQVDAVQAVRDLTHGGAQFAFESAGNEKVLAQAFAATRRGGTTISIGLPHPSKNLSVPAVTLVAEERTIKGSYMGSAVPRRDVPRYIAMYQAGLLPVDRLLSRTISLEEINPAFDALDRGEVLRQVISYT